MAAPAPQLSFKAVLSERSVRRLWIAQLVSVFGDFLAVLAVFAVVTFQLHGTPTQVAMILVAYIALLLGLGMQAVHISGAARERRALSLNSQSLSDMFRSQSEKWLVDMGRRMKNAEELRCGRIPEELEEVHRAFLKSFDKTASDENKKRRYSRMADSEEQQAKVAEEMFRTNERAANYQKTRADKYRKAL